jgi:uncharacterized protein YecT (DUF1311 family)
VIWTLFLMAAEPQVDCGNAMTQADINICSYRGYQAADKTLNAAWETAGAQAKGQSPEAFQRLLDAQRKWIAYRDAQCLAVNGPREESGTIWPLLQNGCMEQLTEARSEQLRDYVETGH